MKFTENMLDDYSKPLSKTEDEQCKNSIRMVAEALKPLGFTDDGRSISTLYPDTYAYSLILNTKDYSRKIKLFVQGSYANNTNVRTESDVDIAVIQEEVFITKYRGSESMFPQCDADYNFTTSPNSTKTFKDEVQECLESKFGTCVERGDKSIKVHGNRYRKDADTVPCKRYRDYRNDYSKTVDNYVGGVVIYPDSGGKIINYPEQHIKNGKEKNNATNHHYKKFVRIIKKMRYLMEDDYNLSYVNAAKGVSSFMLESLLWNISNEWYLDNCKGLKIISFFLIILHLKTHKNDFHNFKEANGIKPLCSSPKEYENLCKFIDQLDEFYNFE